MNLALLKPFARWGYALNWASMDTGHGRHNNDAFVLREDERSGIVTSPVPAHQTRRANLSSPWVR